MNSLVIIACLAAVVVARPSNSGSVSLTQDTVGNYKLNYETEDSSRTEHGSQDGSVIGSFSYKDTDGVLHTIKYVAAHDGFRAESPSDIPRPVQETAAVAAARHAHLAVVARERASLPALVEEEQYQYQHQHHHESALPVHTKEAFTAHQIDNEAEIVASNAAHFAAHSEALARLAEAYRLAPVHSE